MIFESVRESISYILKFHIDLIITITISISIISLIVSTDTGICFGIHVSILIPLKTSRIARAGLFRKLFKINTRERNDNRLFYFMMVIIIDASNLTNRSNTLFILIIIILLIVLIILAVLVILLEYVNISWLFE